MESGQARPLLLASPDSPQCITFFHPILSSCHLEIFLQMGELAISPPVLCNQISRPEDMLSLPGLRSALPVCGQPPAQRPLASQENGTSLSLGTELLGGETAGAPRVASWVTHSDELLVQKGKRAGICKAK